MVRPQCTVEVEEEVRYHRQGGCKFFGRCVTASIVPTRLDDLTQFLH